MRINNSVSKINFGYNKQLNQRLIEKLTQEPRTSLKQTLLSVNESCNDAEKEILYLENNGGYANNHRQINAIAEYLIAAKKYLSSMVESLFPELNYTDIELITYSNEQNLIEDAREIEESKIKNAKLLMQRPACGKMERSVEDAFNWRNILVDVLDMNAEKTNPEDDDYEAEREYYASLRNNQDDESDILTLVPKFIPSESSPKSLDDVCGLDKIIDDIKESIVYTIENPKAAKQREKDYGIAVPHFILLYGPPGCGKTMIAQAISAQTGCNMFMLDVSRIGSEYVNKTSKNIQKAFDYVIEESKKSEKPTILFMDELDSVLSKRNAGGSDDREANKDVNTILANINRLKDTNVIVIGATNMANILDVAGKSRVNISAYVGLPNDADMVKLITKELSKYNKSKNFSQDPEAIKEVAIRLKGYSPRTVINILTAANKLAYRADRELSKEDVYKAIIDGDWEKIKESDYLMGSKGKKSTIGF